MTKREQNLVTGLIAGLTVIGGGMVLHLFALEPYLEVRGELREVSAELAQKQDELNLEKKKVETVLKRDPRLAAWQHTSLSGPSDDLLDLETDLNTIKGVRVENITRSRPVGDPSARARIALTVKVEKMAKGQDGVAVAEVLTKLQKDGWIKADLKFLDLPGPGALVEGTAQLKKTGIDLKFAGGNLALAFPMIKPLPPRQAQGQEGVEANHLSRLRIEYEQYLSSLLSRHEFVPESIKVRRRTPDRQVVPKLASKAPVYERFAFSVSGRGPLASVVKALDDFYRTDLLHEVTSVKIDLAQGKTLGKVVAAKGALDLTLAVEAILVDGADERTTLLPTGIEKLQVLASPSRRYADLAKRNMFIGVPSRTEEGETGPPRVTEDRTEVLRFVRLTSLIYNGERWEASLYNQGKGDKERRLNLSSKEFSIYDKYRNHCMTGTVVLVDEVQMIFRSGGKFYRMRCGDYLHPALESPLESDEVKKLQLTSTAEDE